MKVYFLNIDPNNRIPIIVKGDKATADIVIVCSTNTDEAYNANGGKSLYNDGSTDNIASPIVSFHRPFANHIDFMDGFLKFFAPIYPTENHSLNVISDRDLNDDYSEIENAKLLILIGHSEYWTRQARIYFDKFVDAGKDAMVLSGNSMWWQVRYQADPNNSVNPQLICHRGKTPPFGGGTAYSDEVNECDTLLWTYSWNFPEIKYSTYGSIGSGWLNGGFAQDATGVVYQGFYGYKILLPNSPLLSGTGLQQNAILPRNFINAEGGELDGTLVNRDANDIPVLDNNGDPVLNTAALGFYRAEIIGYDKPAYAPNLAIAPYYAPIMAMQKTCTSGKIINVNSNYWCRESHFANTNVQIITQNMINLLLAGSNIFVSPAPAGFKISPAQTAVSYSACTTNGSIHITPCGVYLNDAHKVDRNDGNFAAKIIDCTSCNSSAKKGESNNVNNSPSNNSAMASNVINENQPDDLSKSPEVFIKPNPTEGKFHISNVPANSIIQVSDMMGNLVLETKASETDNITIDINAKSKGIYIVKVMEHGKVVTIKKLVKL